MAASFEEIDATDGVEKGPVSNEQPGEVQPVAALPTKVGENVPKSEEVLCAEAWIGIARAASKATMVKCASDLGFMFVLRLRCRGKSEVRYPARTVLRMRWE
jgi:hypothetical protein